ncbi:hypothetical protein BC827DRAFT_1205226 [Russula dissimulans]|nr:hypothetical protein BC827DRAFT_1205226 [Russula dissimulans]
MPGPPDGGVTPCFSLMPFKMLPASGSSSTAFILGPVWQRVRREGVIIGWWVIRWHWKVRSP